jgi:hypothetical protein
MTMSVTAVRRGLFGAFATCTLGGLAAATIAIPSAAAEPGCAASDFSRTASGVLASAGGWLDTHPQANDVLSAAVPGATRHRGAADRYAAQLRPGDPADADRRALHGVVPRWRADVTPTSPL